MAQLAMEPIDCRKPSDYSNKLGVSIKQLNRTVRQLTGQTTSLLIQIHQVDQAKTMLVNTDLSVTEVCWELNFEDPSYFCRFFKKHTGDTPLQYRNLHKPPAIN